MNYREVGPLSWEMIFMHDMDGSVGKFSLEHGRKTSNEDKKENEDDTYKKLSRVSFDEMVRIMHDWKTPISRADEVEGFLNLHKWTYAEYLEGMIRRDGLY